MGGSGANPKTRLKSAAVFNNKRLRRQNLRRVMIRRQRGALLVLLSIRRTKTYRAKLPLLYHYIMLFSLGLNDAGREILFVFLFGTHLPFIDFTLNLNWRVIKEALGHAMTKTNS